MIKRIRFLSIIAFGILLVGSSLFAAMFSTQEYATRRARLIEKLRTLQNNMVFANEPLCV